MGAMNTEHPNEVIMTTSNVADWPRFKRLFDDGKVLPDRTGRLRHVRHGAPVGRLILIGLLKDGSPQYKESAEEWFAPDSPKARDFVWP